MTRDELIEKMARAIIDGLGHPERADTPVSVLRGGEWVYAGPMWAVEYVPAAKAALSIIESAGFAVVPREPTKEMKNVAFASILDPLGTLHDAYRAMIAAAQDKS